MSCYRDSYLVMQPLMNNHLSLPCFLAAKVVSSSILECTTRDPRIGIVLTYMIKEANAIAAIIRVPGRIRIANGARSKSTISKIKSQPCKSISLPCSLFMYSSESGSLLRKGSTMNGRSLHNLRRTVASCRSSRRGSNRATRVEVPASGSICGGMNLILGAILGKRSVFLEVCL